MRKVFVKVHVIFSPKGDITPVSFVRDDGRKFEIDKILEIKRAANHAIGGLGFRYDCMVMGKQVALWLDGGKWLYFTTPRIQFCGNG